LFPSPRAFPYWAPPPPPAGNPAHYKVWFREFGPQHKVRFSEIGPQDKVQGLSGLASRV